MVATIWPVDPVDTDADGVPDFPVYAGRALRQMFSVLFNGHRSAAFLGARSGVNPSTDASAVTVTPTTWTVQPCCGVIDLETAAEAGPYMWAFDAPVSGTLIAADSAHDRIDLLSVQMADPAESDGSTIPSVNIVYTEGLASATPAAPATPARSFPLCELNVPKAGTGSPTSTWVAHYLSTAGAITRCLDSGDFPANPYEGQYVDDASTGLLFRRKGSAWVPLLPASLCRLTRTTTIGIGTSETLVVTYDGTPFSVGADITFGAGVFTVHADGAYRWDASVLCPSSTDMVDIYANVNGTPFGSGRERQELISAHQTYLSPGGLLQLSSGDRVQLGLVDLDGSLTVNPLSFSLERRG